MAKTSMVNKSKRKPKFAVRQKSRCLCCGRPRGYLRLFKLCRICFRLKAGFGELPGVRKASW